jgi:hypothetical protein
VTEITRPRLESLNRVAILIVITSLSYTGYTAYREQAARDQFHEYRVDHGYPFGAARALEIRKKNARRGKTGIAILFSQLGSDPKVSDWDKANRQWTKPLRRKIGDAKGSRQTAVFLNFLLAFILLIYPFKKRNRILGVEESTASPD